MSGSDFTTSRRPARAADRHEQTADHALLSSFVCGPMAQVGEHVVTASTARSTAAATGADSPMPSSRTRAGSRRSRTRSTAPPRPASMPSTTAGLMLWASSVGAASSPALEVGDLRLDDGDRARRFAHRHGVDQHERVVAVEQLVGEVHAADAEVGHPHAVGQRPRRQAVGHLDAEAVVAEEDVADAGDEHGSSASPHGDAAARSRRGGSTGSGRASERLGRGVVVDGDGDVQLAVDVVEHAGDRGDQAGEEHVVRVGAARRAQRARWCRVPRPRRRRPPRVSVHGSTAASTPGSHHGTAPRRRVRRRQPARSARMVPCRRSHTSGGMSSQRSTIAAARGSVPRASAFSSSVRVRTRSARISSISVASQRSPSLSGAIAGWSYRMIGDDSTTSAVAVADEHREGAVAGSRATAAPRARRAGRAARRSAPSSTAEQRVHGDERTRAGRVITRRVLAVAVDACSRPRR